MNLNWDASNNSGVIVNTEYPLGALFVGERKPVLSFDYIQFIYQETTDTYVLQGLNDLVMRPMTVEEMDEIKLIGNSWTQLSGEEGNPNILQTADRKRFEMNQIFVTNTSIYMDIVNEYEPVTWSMQLQEAEAYQIEATTLTPALDALLLGRADASITKDELVQKIIDKGAAFKSGYFQELGKLQARNIDIDNFLLQDDKIGLEGLVWI